ncbi:MAG: hypothetical protein ISS01_02525 [Nanoarchaeota archaeon]|nr:hypothetical protein [Nanoarchaeota archaeon]
MEKNLDQLVKGNKVEIRELSGSDYREVVFAGYEGNDFSRKAVFIWPGEMQGHIEGVKVFVNDDFKIYDNGSKVDYSQTTQWAGVHREMQFSFDNLAANVIHEIQEKVEKSFDRYAALLV